MSIKKNFLYNAAYQILLMIMPLITTPYIARVIGAEGVGIQSYTYSIVNYFVLFTMLGVNNHGNRSIAMTRDEKEKLSRPFFSIYSFQVIMGIFMLAVYCGYVMIFVKENKIIAMIQVIYLISALLDINWFFFGLEQFKITVMRNTIIKVATTCSIFIFVRDRNDLYLYAIILALGVLLSQVILWKFVGRHINFVRVSKAEVIAQIKPNLVLFIPVVAISIYKLMDKIMIGGLCNMTEVGFYENSERIINIPLGIITALGTVMLPKMSNLAAKDDNDASKRYIRLSMQFVMFLSIGITFGLMAISNKAVPLFLGSEFNECSVLITLLSITVIFISWANVIRTQYLIPQKKDRIYIISTILGAVVNLVVNIIFIKRFGAAGAVIGTIMAEGTVAVYQSFMVRKELEIRQYLSKGLIYLIPAAVMFIGIKYLEKIIDASDLIIVIIDIIAGGSIYLLLSMACMIIIKDPLISELSVRIDNRKEVRGRE